MNNDLDRLYRKVGIPESTISRAAETQPASREVDGTSRGQVRAAKELPLMTLQDLERLEEQMESSPLETLERARKVWDSGLTEVQLRQAIKHARRALVSPETAARALDAEEAHIRGAAAALPADFTFQGFDSAIHIDPEDRMFENDDVTGVLGWILGAGYLFLSQPLQTSKKDFLFHDGQGFSSQFVYPLESPGAGTPLEVALFSDFGVGRYYSRYIAKQFQNHKFPYVIHLGDVYYAGRESEFDEHIAPLLNPILADTSLYMLNSNHEMLSGGKPYFDYMKKRRQLHPEKQRQEGSYFCLQGDLFQIVGIDTAFFGQGRYKEKKLASWLGDRLRDGRQKGRINILLSADNPYVYGSTKPTKLLKDDLAQLVVVEKLVDLWFWGNTHYCALFDSIDRLPFIGSCIGHGGYPYDTKKRGQPEPAPMLFLEERARFPQATGVRQDKGNNGYCLMRLHQDGSIELRYIDWMSELRCEARLVRDSAGSPVKVVSVNFDS